MKVAVFGGSFSPVHTGHLAVATEVIERRLADEVWLLPCRKNPLKDESGLLPNDIRLQLLEKAVNYQNAQLGGEPLKVCDIELELPSPSYTIDTLRLLSHLYPEYEFRLLAGGDSYLEFEHWKDWEIIETEFSPIVYPRPGNDIGTLRKSWTLLDGVKEWDISSSAIREMLCREGDIPGEFMPWAENQDIGNLKTQIIRNYGKSGH